MDSDRLQRLWTPYRMEYSAHRAKERLAGKSDDPFLDIPKLSDEEGYIIARGELVFAVLNIFPYNPGHSMVIPYRQVAELEDLSTAETAELMLFTKKLIRTIKMVSKPAAFNVGMNLGKAAGGSVSQHLHLHVVPRWIGDASYITVLNDTKIIPQLLSDTRDLLAAAWQKSTLAEEQVDD